MTICDLKSCTACGACINACPKNCISWRKDIYDTLYPQIDDNNCVKCNTCIKVCHNNNPKIQFNRPIHTYAAWSLDDEDHRTSASGGLASVLYRYCVENRIFTAGVELTRKGGAHYIEVKSISDIGRVKNSKYVYSYTDDIYNRIKNHLAQGEKVFFIGLPCQVAALKTFLKDKCDSDNLITADILCHGVANEDYLFQYLDDIESKLGMEADEVCFRDPAYSEGFSFTLRTKQYPSRKRSAFCKETVDDAIRGRVFYDQNHYGSNLYYIGYMGELQYRENCYQCHYARTERISDLTLGDFDGLGDDIPFKYPRRNVSLCLVNTEKGMTFLNKVSAKLFLEERTLEEAVKPQRQLKEPAKGHPQRKLFLENYVKYKNFTKAAAPCLQNELRKNKRFKIISNIYMSVRWLLPVKLLKKIFKR